MNTTNPQKAQSGFTLMEIMFAMAIFAVLLSIAVPSMNKVTAKNAVTVPARTLFTDLEYARSEAVSRSTEVTICASSDGETCSGANNWETGWIVRIDDEDDCPLGECLLRVENSYRLVTLLSSAESVVFNELGETEETFTSNVCGVELEDEDSQAITVNLSGSRSIKKGAASC